MPRQTAAPWAEKIRPPNASAGRRPGRRSHSWINLGQESRLLFVSLPLVGSGTQCAHQVRRDRHTRFENLPVAAFRTSPASRRLPGRRRWSAMKAFRQAVGTGAGLGVDAAAAFTAAARALASASALTFASAL